MPCLLYLNMMPLTYGATLDVANIPLTYYVSRLPQADSINQSISSRAKVLRRTSYSNHSEGWLELVSSDASSIDQPQREKSARWYDEKIVRPKSIDDLLSNIKKIIEGNSLFERTFYSAENLDKYFGALTVKLGSESDVPDQHGAVWAVVTNFDNILGLHDDGHLNGMVSNSELSIGMADDSEDRVKAYLTLIIGHGGPSFQQVQSLFADELTLDTSISHHPPSPAIAPHGNEGWLYRYKDDHEVVRGLFKFNNAGLLSSASFQLVRPKGE